MPRAAHIAQADISRAIRALKSAGYVPEVRIDPDTGEVMVRPTTANGNAETAPLAKPRGIRL
jgi:hypothetical protein